MKKQNRSKIIALVLIVIAIFFSLVLVSRNADTRDYAATNKAPNGSKCNYNSRCASANCRNSVCQPIGCTKDSQCTNGKVCRAGECTDWKCTTNTQCTNGRSCVSGKCIVTKGR